MKVIKVLGVLFLCGMLSGCGIISDVAYDTTDAVQTAVKKEEKQLNLKDVLTVSVNEKRELPEHFTGTVYLMFTKDDLKKGQKTNFYLNDNQLEDVQEESQDDFNIRYHHKTYFSAKKLKVNDLDNIKVVSNWPDDIVLSLRSK
ncbi:hypothetical protein SAMN05216347_104118 [Streptococcus equinus]|uniref:Lipoprotein n=1 Tax=Streptococcus equinus TaxID=1335 RepID=A0A1H0PFF1_STREI|nr:hypothetical protein [Streptococcus equinus]SDP03389.1 hypothetical protein SAMN05216347_104118 [Streptococcus equinus]